MRVEEVYIECRIVINGWDIKEGGKFNGDDAIKIKSVTRFSLNKAV